MIPRPGGWLVHRGNRAFTWLWWSQTVSLFGSQVTLFAIPALAVIALKVPPADFALLTVVETLPYLAFSIPAGELADRLNRRHLLIASNLVRAALLVSLTVTAFMGGLSMPLLYLVAFAVGTASVVFDVAYQSYVPDLLQPDELLGGNQRIELSESAARTAGPALAGTLVAVVGGALAVIVDAVSYVVGAAALIWARPPRRRDLPPDAPRPPSAPPPVPELGNSLEQMVDFAAALERRVADLERLMAPRPSRRGSALAGFRIVLGDRALRDMAASTAIFNLASSAILGAFFYFATVNVGMGLADFGLLMGASNVGFVIGAVAVGAVTARFGIGPTLVVSAILGAIATVLLPLAIGPTAVAFLFAGRFIGAFAIPLFNVNARALRQSRAPREAQGRVIAVFRMIDWGTLPVGGLLAAWIGSVWGVHATLMVSAALGIASAAWLVWSPLRNLRQLGAGPEIAVAGGKEAAVGAEAAGRQVQVIERRMVGPAASMAWPLTITGRIPSIRWAWLAIGGVALQLSLVAPAVQTLVGSNAPAIYVTSGILVLACVIRNLSIPGLAVVALGGASNLVAILANGGYMPVSAEAARAVGHAVVTGYTNTMVTANAALKPLTDIIVVPPPLPLANVYSVGDLLIVMGIAITLVTAMHGRAVEPLTPESPNPSTARLGTSAP